MNCVSSDICVYHLWFVCVFSLAGVVLSSRVTGACPVTTDLIMRVNVRTTTTELLLFINELQSDWSLSCDHGLDYAS